MEGLLDELDEAFLTIDFGQGPLDFQIDTGFSGTLIVGEDCSILRSPRQPAPLKPVWRRSEDEQARFLLEARALADERSFLVASRFTF